MSSAFCLPGEGSGSRGCVVRGCVAVLCRGVWLKRQEVPSRGPETGAASRRVRRLPGCASPRGAAPCPQPPARCFPKAAFLLFFFSPLSRGSSGWRRRFSIAWQRSACSNRGVERGSPAKGPGSGAAAAGGGRAAGPAGRSGCSSLSFPAGGRKSGREWLVGTDNCAGLSRWKLALAAG